MSSAKYTAIIPAAGIGSRMQSGLPKQYLKIMDASVIEYCLRTFIAQRTISNIVVVLNPKDSYFQNLSISAHTKIHQVIGGELRSDSVLEGVKYAKNILNSDWVLVHDAARPGLSANALHRLIAEVTESDGGILAMPAVDTIKLSSNDTIDKTLDRNHIWQAQTPQMFRCNQLLSALEYARNNGLEVTDEASAMEMKGFKIKLVEGEKRNLKITTHDDLKLAEFYLSKDIPHEL